VKLLEAELMALKDKITPDPDLKGYITDPSMIRPYKVKTTGVDGDIKEAPDAFTRPLDHLEKQEYVEVVSAIELDGETLDKIKEDVDRAYGFDIRIKNTVEEPIIGGLIIKIGEKVIDLSVRNKLEDIKAKLKSTRLGGEGFGTED
jgi:hypothetical protein